MADALAYLTDAGWPIERLQWYMRNGVELSDVETAVKDIFRYADSPQFEEVGEQEEIGNEPFSGGAKITVATVADR